MPTSQCGGLEVDRLLAVFRTVMLFGIVALVVLAVVTAILASISKGPLGENQMAHEKSRTGGTLLRDAWQPTIG